MTGLLVHHRPYRLIREALSTRVTPAPGKGRLWPLTQILKLSDEVLRPTTGYLSVQSYRRVYG